MIERDIYLDRLHRVPIVPYPQGGSGTPIKLIFKDAAIPAGTVRVFVHRPDDGEVYRDVLAVDVNRSQPVGQQFVIVRVVHEMTAVNGNCTCQIQVQGNDSTLSSVQADALGATLSFPFTLAVTNSPTAWASMYARDDYQTLIDALAKVSSIASEGGSAVADAKQAVKDANTAIQRSETAASTAESAASAANAAASKATTAANSADTAAGKATSAASEASRAAESANSAATQATTAAQGADSSAAKADKSAQSADTAAANANSKATLAQEAADAANGAAASANTAKQNADKATQAAKDATEGAETATQAANEAAERANTSADDADAATESANAAAQKANASATAADEAAEAANQTNSDIEAAEALRKAAESTRVEQETARQTADTKRTQNTDAAVKKVDDKLSELETTVSGWEEAEQGRVEAEGERANAEDARVEAENARVEAESGRVSADAQRTLQQEANNAQQAQNNAAAMGLQFKILHEGEYDQESLVPTVEGKVGVFYLTPYNKEEGQDLYAEWIWDVEGDRFERVGNTSVNVEFGTTGQIDRIISGESVTADGMVNMTLMSYYDKARKTANDLVYATIEYADGTFAKATVTTKLQKDVEAAQAAADAAQDAADGAQGTADTALESAQTAETHAQQGISDAASALSAAQAAQTTATKGVSDAATAQTTAQAAQKAAEDAQSTADSALAAIPKLVSKTKEGLVPKLPEDAGTNKSYSLGADEDGNPSWMESRGGGSGAGPMAFEVRKDGHLWVVYDDAIGEPDLYINDQGHLMWRYTTEVEA